MKNEKEQEEQTPGHNEKSTEERRNTILFFLQGEYNDVRKKLFMVGRNERIQSCSGSTQRSGKSDAEAKWRGVSSDGVINKSVNGVSGLMSVVTPQAGR